MTWTARPLRKDGPRYLALAERIQLDVESGRLKAGTQLPPQRELAAELGVDFTTVSRAYAEARRRGLVHAHVGRGTFVRAAASGVGANQGRGAEIDLSLNVLATVVGGRAAQELSTALARQSSSELLGTLLQYQANAGREDHRAAGAAWVAGRGIEADAERVLVCSGGQLALAAVTLALTSAGDAVHTEAYTYPVFKTLAEQLERRLVPLPMDDHGLLVEPLREACASGAVKVLYTIPTLQNPTTAVMPASRRREIGRVVQQYGVRVIEDDAYGYLVADGPPALATYAPEQVYHVSTLSKAVAPGLRIAYLVAPDRRAAAQVGASLRALMWMAVPITADIAASWVRSGTAAEILTANRAEAASRQSLAARLLRGHRWRAHPTGYHGWLELPEPWTSAEFVMQARRDGVVLAPSDSFHVGPAPAQAAVRVCVGAAPDRDALAAALERLVTLLDGGPEATAPVL